MGGFYASAKRKGDNMLYIYAVVGSVTTASRLARELERRQIRATVTHTPSHINRGGCSYSVRIRAADRNALERAAAERRIKVRKMLGSDGEHFYDLP